MKNHSKQLRFRYLFPLARLLACGWRKVASVTTGSKPHFYFRRVTMGRQWIAWDRVASAWVFTHEG